MARAIWSGSISFGLVNIPVKLHSAVRRKTVRFNQIDSVTGSRVKQKRVSAADGREVDYDDIVKGYELPSGEYVTITEDELAGLDPESVRTIDISEFVDLADIDPILYENAYYLAPDPSTAKPYKLLATALEDSQKVGIAKFVMRTKQYLAAVRPKDGRLLLSTMVYADELVPGEEIEGFDGLDDVEVSKKELTMAMQLIESLAEEFEPGKHTDTYREAVLAMIDRKAAGVEEVIAAPAEPGSDKVVDLMAALEASVAEAKRSRGQATPVTATKSAGTKKSVAKKSVAKKPAPKKAAGKNAGAKNAGPKNAGPKNAGAKKPAPKKAAGKKAGAKKSPAKKAS